MKTLTLLFPLAALSLLPAQRTIIVDVAGGPGHHYKRLDTAVKAASSGDILLIRPGRYYYGTFYATPIKKWLTFQSANPIYKPQIYAMSATGIPAGSALVFKDLQIDGIYVQDSKGSLILDNVRVFHDRQQLSGVTWVTRARLHATRVDGGGIVALDSTISINSSNYVTGHNNWGLISLQNCLADITDTVIKSGPRRTGTGWIPTLKIGSTLKNPPPVRIRGNSLLVARRASSYANWSPVVLSDKNQGLVIGPQVRLVQETPFSLVTEWMPPGGVRRQAMPRLLGGPAPTLGKNWSYTLHGAAQEPFAIAIGAYNPLLQKTWPQVSLDLRAFVLLQRGQLGSSGTAAFTIKHTTNPAFRGIPLVMQGVVGRYAQFTNPAPLNVR